MTERQQFVLRRVIAAHRRGGKWYRAASSGERVTLASLFHRQALDRRIWRGKNRDAAHEYQVGPHIRLQLGLQELA